MSRFEVYCDDRPCALDMICSRDQLCSSEPSAQDDRAVIRLLGPVILIGQVHTEYRCFDKVIAPAGVVMVRDAVVSARRFKTRCAVKNATGRMHYSKSPRSRDPTNTEVDPHWQQDARAESDLGSM